MGPLVRHFTNTPVPLPNNASVLKGRKLEKKRETCQLQQNTELNSLNDFCASGDVLHFKFRYHNADWKHVNAHKDRLWSKALLKI